MRTVLVGPSAPLRGGIAIDNDALAQALVQAGHQIEQISFSRLYPTWLFPGRTQYDTSTNVPPSPARHCLDSLNPLNWWNTATTLARLRPHLVTFQWWHPFFAPCYATLLARVKRLCPVVPRVLI